ncbi:MAG: substrate-binding domain-containing protein [Clostridia bacterium]|nr:substrate-binding domain-containing protein [Clostridia bacterium]
MRKPVALLLACLLLLGMVCACVSGAKKGAEPPGLSVVTTIFPVYDWVRNVVGDRADVTVSMLLDSGVELPDAIIVESDMIAMGVLKSLVRRGIDVPEKIRLSGYDNTDISAMSNPSLTSVHIPLEEICLAALNMLWAMMQGEAVSPVTFHTDLEIRTSTMPPK